MEQNQNMSPLSDIRPQQPSDSTMQSTESASRNKTLKTVLIVIVAILIVWGVWAVLKKEGVIDRDYTERIAPEGEVVGDFPRELIPEGDAKNISSAALDYDDGNTLPAVAYTSNKTLEENIVLFKNLLAEGGWTIEREAVATENPTNFYATRDGNDVNITLTVSEEEVRVLISYLKRAQ